MKTADVLKHARKICLSVMALAAIMLLASPLLADEGDPPGRVARLSFMSGNVSFQPAGEDQWSQASVNYPLTTGDRIYTDRDGRAELETGNIAIRLSADTDVTAANLTDELLQIGLAQGTLRVRVYDIREGNAMEIVTGNATLTILRAGSYRVETYPDDNITLIVVTRGELEVNGDGFSEVVRSGQALQLTGTDQVEPEWVSAPDNDDFDQWSGDRDRRFLGGDSRKYVSTYSPGYSDLDQYGRWDSDNQYGQVWYPSTVAVDWAPYRYGRWVWVQPWGWTWVAEEPWGFTPFHYGRWVFIRSRWAWCPGPVAVRPVYAPALVAFVGGPRAGISVWFPLGPRDPYFPSYRHSDRYLREVNVTNVTVRNVTVINNYINVRDRDRGEVRYQYQRVAPTAVSTEAFRSARPVHRELVRLNADEIGRTRVITQVEVKPDARAIHGGTQQTRPPVQAERPKFEQGKPGGVIRPGTQPGVARPGTQPGVARPGTQLPAPQQPAQDTRGGRGRDAGRTQPGAAQPTRTPPAAGQPGEAGGRRAPDAGRPVATPPPGQPLSGGGLKVPATQPPATQQPAAQQPTPGNRDAGRGRDAGGTQPGVPTRTPPPAAGQPGEAGGRRAPDTGRPVATPPPGQPLSGGGHQVPATQPPATQQPAVQQPTPGNRDAGRGRDAGGTQPGAPTRTPPPAAGQPGAAVDRRTPDTGNRPVTPAPQQPAVTRPTVAPTRTPPPSTGQPGEAVDRRAPDRGNRPVATPPPSQPLSGSERQVPAARNPPPAAQQPAQERRPTVTNTPPPQERRPTVTNTPPPQERRPTVTNTPPPQERRPTVTNTPPPAQRPAVEQRQSEQRQPEQRQPAQAQPAGPPRDREAAPRQQPPPAQAPAQAAPKPTPTPDKKDNKDKKDDKDKKN